MIAVDRYVKQCRGIGICAALILVAVALPAETALSTSFAFPGAITFLQRSRGSTPWLYPRPRMPSSWDGRTYHLYMGVRGGMGLPTLEGKSLLANEYNSNFSIMTETGFVFGLHFFIPVYRFFAFQLEGNYENPGTSTWARDGGQSVVLGKTGGDEKSGSLLTIPLLLVLPLESSGKYLHLFGGGYVSLPLEVQSYSIKGDDDVQVTSGEVTLSPVFGWTVGLRVGFRYKKFSPFLDGRYSRDLNAFTGSGVAGSSGELYRRDIIFLSLGVEVGLIRWRVRRPNPPANATPASSGRSGKALGA
ncbi:MAG: PorT family protein [Spirochaetaceae bacterium]|jgi:hypothetical protein|nr:PorT family protein [Spirochaetaceae bacterium]